MHIILRAHTYICKYIEIGMHVYYVHVSIRASIAHTAMHKRIGLLYTRDVYYINEWRKEVNKRSKN